MKIYTSICRLNSKTILAKFLPASLLGVYAGYCQRALIGEAGVIRTQVGKQNIM
jgi:hypothetical protein